MPPRSTPITLRRARPLRRAPPAPRFAMPDDKPDYRVYRSRPGSDRLFNRRDGAARRAADLRCRRPPRAGTAAPARPRPHLPAAPPVPALVAADHLEEGGRRRSASSVPGAQPRALPDQREPAAGKVSDGTKAALDDSGNMLTSPNNILVLGSDRRPGRGAGARRRGHDHADALRGRQGGAAVDPARHAREHPGHRPEQDQRRLCDRRAGADDRDDQAVPRHRGEPPRRDRLQGLREVRGRARRRRHRPSRTASGRFEGRHPPLLQGREPPRRRGGARHRADPQERVRAGGVRPHARAPPAAVPGGREGQALQPVHVPALPVGRVAGAEGDHLRHGRPPAARLLRRREGDRRLTVQRTCSRASPRATACACPTRSSGARCDGS